MSLWATDMATHGRPDITADSMLREQHDYVDSALERLNSASRVVHEPLQSQSPGAAGD
jgi:hypothetical protein